MTLLQFLFVFACLPFLIFTGIMIVLLLIAPNGYEDATGFHTIDDKD